LATEENYPSSTFNRSGILFAANNTQDRLDIIDPCTCTITPVGSFGFEAEVVGITTDQATDLFGLDKLADQLLSISSLDGTASIIGPMGVSFEASGATWSDTEQALFAVNSGDEALYMIDPETGTATHKADLSKSIGTVGIELHPGNNVIYACTATDLWSIDSETGQVTVIGNINGNICNNLAAPYTKVVCPDWPQE
jgi:hypothetical protein